MLIYPIQILYIFITFIFLDRNGYGLRYSAIYMLIFSSMPLVWIGVAILPIHLFAIGVLIWFLLKSTPISRDVFIGAGITLLPFLLSILYNIFYFEPVLGWAYEVSERIGWSKIVLKKSLTTTNITQLIYLIFGLMLVVVYASIPLKKEKVIRVLELMFISLCVIGLFQLLMYYTGLHSVYKAIFYPLPIPMVDQMFIWGIKRINATFSEPSYFGYFIFFLLGLYLEIVGYRAFLKSYIVRATILVGMLSTATTFLWGFCILAFFLYVLYSTENEKMYYYIIGAFLMPFVLYFGLDAAMEVVDSKQGSTGERMLVSWDLAWNQFFVSPFFGVAYGTGRSLFFYTMLLSSIGLIGTPIFIFGMLIMAKTIQAKRYLMLAGGIGIATFELVRPEMWLFIGLLCNPYIVNNKNDIAFS